MDTALVLEIPEAEPIVGRWRAEFDPSARAGLPAHVTLIYPFVPFSRIDEEIRERLADLLSATAPIAMRFTATGRFPDTLWLARTIPLRSSPSSAS